MIGFGIDQVQAEFVAEIRFAEYQQEYILEADRRDRRPGAGDPGPGGDSLKSDRRISKHHHQRIGAGLQEVWPTPEGGDPVPLGHRFRG
ncbi:MAG: hypothetical protein ACLU9S_12975 [Oscillospiraceae bacterium]